MSFQQEFDAPSTSSTMLNLRTLPEPGVPKSSSESGILAVEVNSLEEMIQSEEKAIKLARQKSSLKQDEEALKIELEGSLEKNDAVLNGQQLPKAEKELKIISLDELAWHDTPDDCWFAIYDYVYDCTSFIKDHPGGDDVLLEYAGRDATLAFIGAGHSKFAQKALERYLIGELPPNERIFRIAGGVKVYGI